MAKTNTQFYIQCFLENAHFFHSYHSIFEIFIDFFTDTKL